MAHDIIGDIHGQAGKLHALLARLGYREHHGALRHPQRTAIFVGDFIDRGPQQVESVRTVQRMVDAGSAQAVMGNHEFNAIAWHTADPQAPGDTLRSRRGEAGRKNRHQHAAFLAEVEDRPLLHAELVAWFLDLPLWLDLPGLRVVHACWHDAHRAALGPLLQPGARLDIALVEAASRRGSVAYEAIETLTKGPEIALPAGHSFHDKDGHERHHVRIRWWDATATTYRKLAMLSADLRQGLPDTPVPPLQRTARDDPAKPVFFGHYWMTGRPALQSPTIACVDYSAGKGGPLVAYRWDGEPLLDATHFTSSE